MKWMDRILGLLGVRESPATAEPGHTLGKVLIVGSPNVGKSLIFNRLTGQYVTVSNYPGTTVEISSGHLKTSRGVVEVIDTPGMYSLASITAEEKVAYDMLFVEGVVAVIHVVDAKNMDRMLPLTLQLAEARLPLILVLNMADEAQDLGIRINTPKLQERVGVPVIETVATTGYGIPELIRQLSFAEPARDPEIHYGPHLQKAIHAIAGQLDAQGRVSTRSQALLLLQMERAEAEKQLAGLGQEKAQRLSHLIGDVQRHLDHSTHYHATYALKQRVAEILKESVIFPVEEGRRFREQLSRILMRPIWGVPILIAVLYFGLYKFVGGFGAGYLVDFLQTWFGNHITPWADRLVTFAIPWVSGRELFMGEYGIVTLGIRYAIAIIFPVVGTFFIAFSVLEDSGYLPRLAMLIDRLFKRIGLNGRAVIPLVLGLGCGTMATMVTRTLETRRERLIATILLALAVPCSAQIGVILGLMGQHPGALLAWAAFILLVFIVTGLLAAKIIPDAGPRFYMELPPLRLPKLSNVMAKTVSRMTWYFREVFPLFILASLLIWVGQITGVFQLLVRALTPVVHLIGLPSEAAVIFLFGFFRRDYGAAGLYDLQKAGLLSGEQLAVASITLTLFLPCVAQFLIMIKERGMKPALAISAFTFVFAFAAGYAVNLLMHSAGLTL